MSRTPAAGDGDDLGELPPLDGEAEEIPPPTADGIDDDGPAGEASLDDQTGEDQPPDEDDLDEIARDEGDKSWLADASVSDELDVDDSDLADPESAGSFLDDAEPPDLQDARDDVAFDSSERVDADGGDEGPVAPDDELREEDLPALDADDGDSDDVPFDEPLAFDEAAGPPWAAAPWVRVGAPVDVASASAVVCVPRGAIVAEGSERMGAGLLRIDLEGSGERLPSVSAARAPFVALTVDGSRLAGVLLDGRVTVSDDLGRSFSEVAFEAADVLLASGALWLRTASGELFASTDGGKSVNRVVLPGAAVAIAKNGPAGITALVVDGSQRPISLARAENGPPTIALEATNAPAAVVPALLASRAGHDAYVAPRAIVRRSPRGSWQSLPWSGPIAAMTFVDDSGTLVVATYSDADDTTALVRIDASEGAAVVARIGAVRPRDGEVAVADGRGRVRALACDDSCGVVWAVGAFGVATFSVAT